MRSKEVRELEKQLAMLNGQEKEARKLVNEL
jgi:hypothetical protein